MRKLTRVLFSTALPALVLCVTAKDARAQSNLGPPDLPVMQELATTYGWANAFGWDANANPCPVYGWNNWNGVICVRGRVQGIVESCSSTLLNAPLPPILAPLTELTTFQVSRCGLTGPLPDLSALYNLSSLWLDGNALTSLPDSITTWPNLYILNLENNQLTGAIPQFPNNQYVITRLAGNFFTSVSPAWTSFNRDISYNCIPSLPPTCDSQSNTNTCTPNRSDCPATMALSKVSGDGQWAQADTNFANPLVVSVTDFSGNPISGVTVNFSGPGIVTTTANSDSNGQASAVIQASSTVGGNTVTASAGATPMITFGLTAGDTAACSAYIAVANTAASGAGSLQDALADVCPGGTIDLTPIAGQTIALSAGAPAYNFSGRLYIATDVTILGAGVTISGSGLTRIFFVQNGNVTMNNLTLTNGVGQGGTSQFGGSSGGLGGAIFENNGNLTLNNVVLTSDQAIGGSADQSGSVTGGGFGGGAGSGDLGGAAGPGDGAGGVVAGIGGQGGFAAGGGEGIVDLSYAGTPGGLGGFAGGGGWASPNFFYNENTWVSGLAGYGGSEGSPTMDGGNPGGGGGAGFGGAIFVRNGNLNLNNVSFANNSAIGGTGAQGKGGALFIYSGANLNMVPNTVTYSGDVAAAAGQPGQGYSGDPYDNNNTCPGVDTVDVCGILPTNTLALSLTGAGSVMDTTGLINCPAINCSALFQTSATLNAISSSGSYFTGWSGGGCSGTGPCTVSLSNGNASVVATFTAVGTISPTSGSGQSTMTGAQFANPLVVTVTDVNNNPVPGATVTFNAPGSGPSATLSAPAVTNSQGQTSVSATANSTPGAYMVTASVAGVAGSASFNLTNLGGLAALTISAGNNQSTTPGAPFAINLQVTATDSVGDSLAGLPVTFTANTAPGGASGTFASSSTNVDMESTNGAGVAQASVLTANAGTGKFSVTATAGNLSQTFTLTNGSSSSISLSGQASAVFGQPFTLTANLTPNTVSGDVTFYAGTNILGVAPLTNGVATLTTPFLTAGPNSLTALFDGGGSYAPSLSAGQSSTVTPYPSPSLGSPVVYPAASATNQVVVGDFNGDGIPDLLMVSQSGNSFTVLLGNPGGTFAGGAPQAPSSGECTPAGSAVTCAIAGPVAAAVGDFNRDGKQDVAIAGSAGVNILLGNGDGTFQAPVTYPVSPAFAVAVGDLNGDGLADLVVSGSANLWTMLGNGDGTFQQQMGPYSAASVAVALVMGDFNNDGIPDVAAAGNTPSVSVLLGKGDGTLGTAATYPTSAQNNSIAAGHFYSPANLDLVVANSGQNTLNVLPNAGNGTFPTSQTVLLPQGINASGVGVGDFNGDGIADLAAGSSNGSILVWLGSGGGSFGNPSTYTLPGNAAVANLVVADFNRDGRTDLAAAGANLNGAAVLLGAIASGRIGKTAGDNQSAGVGQAFAANLQVTITDSGNNPVPNVTVTFSAPPSGAGGTFAGGVSTAITNGYGIATAPFFTANNTAGAYQVSAAAPGLTAVNFSLTNTAGAPAHIAPTSGGGQSAIQNAPFANPLVVTVTDTYGNPVQNTTVTFTAPPQTGASLTFAGGINTASTNANGVATSAVLTANAIAGGYNVLATANSLSTSFSLTNLSSTTNLSLAPLTGSVPVNTQYTVTATATGPGNSPVANASVSFTVVSGPNAGAKGSGSTNGNGQASFTYTGSGGTGADTIQASSGSLASNTVQVSWVTPDTLSLLPILPSNESYGVALPVVVSAVLGWSAKGKAATGTITFSSTAGGGFAGSPLCVKLGDTMTCAQTFKPSPADALGEYTFSAAYAGDSNFAPASTSGTNDFGVTQQKPAVNVTSISPASETYGQGTGVTVNASLSWLGTGAAPTAPQGQWLTFNSTAPGKFGAATCSGTNPIQCNVSFTPTVTDAPGSYTISASYAGDTNYASATSPQVKNFAINSYTPAVSLGPVTVTKGSTSPVQVTASFTGAGASDAAPNGAVSFSATSGSFSGQSCSSSGDVLTCSVTYHPTGKLGAGTYTNYLSASIVASGDYMAAAGHATLSVIP